MSYKRTKENKIEAFNNDAGGDKAWEAKEIVYEDGRKMVYFYVVSGQQMLLTRPTAEALRDFLNDFLVGSS